MYVYHVHGTLPRLGVYRHPLIRAEEADYNSGSCDKWYITKLLYKDKKKNNQLVQIIKENLTKPPPMPQNEWH